MDGKPRTRRPPHPTENSEAELGDPSGTLYVPTPDPEFSLAQAPSMPRKVLVWTGPDGNWLGVFTPEFPSLKPCYDLQKVEELSPTAQERGSSPPQVSLFLGLWLLAVALLVCQLWAIFLLNWE